jgi:hypothetical protein
MIVKGLKLYVTITKTTPKMMKLYHFDGKFCVYFLNGQADIFSNILEYDLTQLDTSFQKKAI